MRYNVYTFVDLGYCNFKGGSTRKRFTSMAFKRVELFPILYPWIEGGRAVSLNEAAIV